MWCGQSNYILNERRISFCSGLDSSLICVFLFTLLKSSVKMENVKDRINLFENKSCGSPSIIQVKLATV